MDAIKIEGSGTQTVFKKLTPEIDIELVPIRKWLRILLKGNGNYLENLWQFKIYPRSSKIYIDGTDRWNISDIARQNRKYKEIEELKGMVMKYGLSKKFRNHYVGFAKSQQKDFYQKNKTKCLLYVYRVLMSGIVLFRDTKVEYNLPRLLELYPSDYVQMLMDKYDSEQSVMNDVITRNIQHEFDAMEETLNMYADKSDLPDKPNYSVFNDFLYMWYKEELKWF